MSERHDIILRERQGDSPNPPGLLNAIQQDLHDLFRSATEGGGGWIRGKGKQEQAKAAEIFSRAMAEIGRLQAEEERLAQKHERDVEAADARRQAQQMAHQQTMYALETDRMRAKASALKEIVSALKELRSLGIEVDIQVIMVEIFNVASTSEPSGMGPRLPAT